MKLKKVKEANVYELKLSEETTLFIEIFKYHDSKQNFWIMEDEVTENATLSEDDHPHLYMLVRKILEEKGLLKVK